MDGLARDGVLRELKGPALAVLVAVGRSGGATHAQVSAATGWGRNTTYEALRRLVEAGWLAADGRGCWLLTGAGEEVWDGLWGGGRGAARAARANGREEAPGDGTEGEAAVPESGTVIHSLGTGVPEGGTVVHRQGKRVPGNGTKRVPGNGTKRRKRVPGSGTAPVVVPGNGTGRDHDDHDDVDDQQTADSNIIQRLEALRPGFGRAREWLPKQRREVVVAWLDYLERAPPERMASYGNPTGLLRSCVESGSWPPPLPGERKKRRACVKCGHSVWDADGSCLVCAGVVKY